MSAPSASQTALITGASSGIGAATAKIFADQGFDLLLLGRNQERLNNTAQNCVGVKVETLAQDLNQLDSKLLSEKLQRLSPLTILVNNAGIYQMASVQETTTQIWENMFQTNLLSTVKLTQFCWKIFSKNKKGSIVNVASTLGIKPIPQTSAYSALKAAMVNWTMSLAQEGGVLNIRANCICPGIIDTPIHSFHTMDEINKKSVEENISKLQLIQKLGKPDDVAESIFFLASEKSKFTTGSILHVDGGVHIK